MEETDALEKEIARLEGILASRAKIQKLIVKDLQRVMKQYPAPRRSEIVYQNQIEMEEEEEEIARYPVSLFLTRDGYLKKITPASLRMNSEQKYKEEDGLLQRLEADNADELLLLTNRQQAYKLRLHELDDSKASALGEFLPARLSMAEGERPLFALLPGAYDGYLITVFANGKAPRWR